MPEIAFVGRSNAGKSTCINTLTQQKRLAFASKTPGRTQSINLFALGKQGVTDAMLADLPGYGYAAVPKQDKLRWQQVMANYLVTRENLHGVVLLCDPRHGLTELDDILLEVIRPRVEQGLKFLLLLTKADKLNRSEQAKALSIARLQAGGGEVKLFSALKKQGVEEAAVLLWQWAHPETARHDREIPASPAARHHPELPRRRRARPAGAGVPARLSRGGLRLGRTAGTFRPAGERRLPLRGAEPARLREIERSRPTSRPTAPNHLVQDIAALIADRRRRRIECLVAHDWGGAVAWNLANQLPQLDEEAGHHQLAAPGHLPARTASRTRSSRPPAPT